MSSHVHQRCLLFFFFHFNYSEVAILNERKKIDETKKQRKYFMNFSFRRRNQSEKELKYNIQSLDILF